MDARVQQVIELFRQKGHSLYGGEAVTQLAHGLQAATFARRDGANAAQVSAALLHDIGHLLHALPDDAPDQGIDDVHERLGAHYLAANFSPAVCEPVRLHVAAKRYLCRVDPDYLSQLSEPSLQSLALQGGPMTGEEASDFEQEPYFREAVQLRRWDEEAKIPELKTADLESFLPELSNSLKG
jgi:phosphonate degradation associated HDIG domain protein